MSIPLSLSLWLTSAVIFSPFIAVCLLSVIVASFGFVSSCTFKLAVFPPFSPSHNLAVTMLFNSNPVTLLPLVIVLYSPVSILYCISKSSLIVFVIVTSAFPLFHTKLPNVIAPSALGTIPVLPTASFDAVPFSFVTSTFTVYLLFSSNPVIV